MGRRRLAHFQIGTEPIFRYTVGMKSIVPQRLAYGILAALAMFAMIVTGCSSTKKVDWNSRVGTYTFDDAVTELGPPDKQTTMSDGKKVADWVTRRAGGTSIGFGVGSYGSHGGVGVGQTVGSGYRESVTRLVFGTDGKLVSWTKN